MAKVLHSPLAMAAPHPQTGRLHLRLQASGDEQSLTALLLTPRGMVPLPPIPQPPLLQLPGGSCRAGGTALPANAAVIADW